MNKNKNKHRFCFFGKPSSEKWIFDEEEAFHAQKVLRLNIGDEVEFFDGCGSRGFGNIVRLEKKSMEVNPVEIFFEQKKTPYVLAVVPFLKGQDGIAQYVSSLIELGISTVFIYQSEGDSREISAHQKERIHKIQREACKQSKRAWECPFFYFYDLESAITDAKKILGQHIYVMNFESSDKHKQDQKESIGYVVGAEKGFTSKEQMILEGLPKVSLGPFVLRAYTGIIAGATWAISCYNPQYNTRITLSL